jgi:thioesterase domain-containing protein
MKTLESPSGDADVWSRGRTLVTLQRQIVANSSIVEIQPEGNRPPLFLVHGVGGGMLWGYQNLARHLADQPIYAFKSRGLDGLEEFSTIEEIAAQYAKDLRQFQPDGPYYLGGYCFGGNVAYEMARLLTNEGCRVAPLLLLNSWPNNSQYTRCRRTPLFLLKFLWNIALRLKCQVHQGARRPQNYFKWRTAWACKKARAFITQNSEDELACPDMVELLPKPEHERKLWRTHVQAWTHYVPQRYAGDIVLFRTPGHPLVCSFDHRMGWGDFVDGKIMVKICRGDHESILENENVAFTAREVKSLLNEIQISKPTMVPQSAKILSS